MKNAHEIRKQIKALDNALADAFAEEVMEIKAQLAILWKELLLIRKTGTASA